MPAEATYTCQAIDDHLARESGRIGPRIYRKGLYRSFWLAAIEQEEWPNHMGRQIQQLISKRTQPSVIQEWTNIGISDGDEVNGCLPPVETIPYAHDLASYNLQHVAVESDPICLEDLRTSVFPAEELTNYFTGFEEYVNVKWIRRFRDEYLRLSEHKIIVEPAFTEDSAAFPSVYPTSQMTLGVAKRYWTRLVRDNAGTDGLAFDEKNTPIFPMITSYETMENIRHLNDELRQDFRWSPRVSELLDPMGISTSYGGFSFIPDPFPPRYNRDGAGGYVRVPEYVGAAATKGTKQEVNPAYETAEFEVSFIFHPKVFKALNPSPSVPTGSKIRYDAQNYRGDVRWINEYDKQCNPDKNTGYWRAKLASASKPIFTEYGHAFMHLRCDPAAGLLACPSGSGYIS